MLELHARMLHVVCSLDVFLLVLRPMRCQLSDHLRHNSVRLLSNEGGLAMKTV